MEKQNTQLNLKIGFIQFSPELGNLEKTLANLDALLPQVKNADLIVLPELCNSGYNFKDKNQARETSEPISDSRFLRFLTESAAKYNLAIITGFNERLGAMLYNSAIIVTPHGYAGKYQKIHLFAREKEFFEPGIEGLPVFEYKHAVVGIQICFDWMFPESWRVLTLKGVDIICHPSNLVLPGLAQKAVPIHALTNRIFTVTANRIGKEGNLTFTGLSTIANPKGKVILQSSESSTETGVIEIDLSEARDKYITPQNHILEDRKPTEYMYLTESRENE